MHVTRAYLYGDIPDDGFPFTLPLIQNFTSLDFTAPVTFFTGENGSGKSTLLEAIAMAARLPAIGEDDLERDESLRHARRLSDFIRMAWHSRHHRGFFLRAEDFFAWQKRTNVLMEELKSQADGYDRELEANPGDLGTLRARGYILGQRRALSERYGADTDARSHGEAFLNLFQQRLVPDGLYVLDEPETPLSPLRQLAFLGLMKTFVATNCQFIIATHSPILMAFPGAQLLDFNTHPVQPIAYDDVEHVSLTRRFLSDPEAYLRRL